MSGPMAIQVTKNQAPVICAFTSYLVGAGDPGLPGVP